jgi:hypothetical protein
MAMMFMFKPSRLFALGALWHLCSSTRDALPVSTAESISKHDYIFVVGQHHRQVRFENIDFRANYRDSGTTLMALVLCQHHNVSCLTTGNLLSLERALD